MLLPERILINPQVAPTPVPALSSVCPPIPPVVLAPIPAFTVTSPPVDEAALVSPADTSTLPPSNLVPDAIEIKIFPPFPPVASPVDTITAPLEPALDVPDWNVKLPLTPVVPASTVFKIKDPLDVALP